MPGVPPSRLFLVVVRWTTASCVFGSLYKHDDNINSEMQQETCEPYARPLRSHDPCVGESGEVWSHVHKTECNCLGAANDKPSKVLYLPDLLLYLSMYLPIYLSIYLFIYLSIYLSIYQSFYLSIIFLFIYPPIYQIYQSIS